MSAGGWFDDLDSKYRVARLAAEADADRLAATVGKPARRRAGRLTRTLRTSWWPRILVAGALVIVVGITLVSDAAKTWVILAGAAIVFAVICKWLSMSSGGYRREPPMPPGAGSPGG
jgi:hypothetical protein